MVALIDCEYQGLQIVTSHEVNCIRHQHRPIAFAMMITMDIQFINFQLIWLPGKHTAGKTYNGPIQNQLSPPNSWILELVLNQRRLISLRQHIVNLSR